MKKRAESQQKLPYDPKLVALPSTVGQGPKIAVGLRFDSKKRKNEKLPGPDYVPKPLGSDRPKISFALHPISKQKKPVDPKIKVFPGPGAYDIRPVFANEAVKFSLHQRTGVHEDESVSPGPAAYNPDISAVKPKALARFLHQRPEVKVKERGPGYVDLGSTLKRQGFTIGRRETLELVRIA
jgi:hypothetical protein